jgi:hypothetical protein
MAMSFVVLPAFAPLVVFCGDVIYGIVVVYIITYIIVGSALTTIGTTNGSILPLIIFRAIKSMLSCSLFTPKHEAPPSSTLLFFLKTLLEEFVVTFLLLYSIIYISSLILLTSTDGFCGFSF